MGEFLSPSCPVCHRIYPISVWGKIAASNADYLGILQRSRGRGQIEVIGRMYDPRDLDWVSVEGFGVSMKRQPAPFELVKACLMRSLGRWADRGWLTSADLSTVGLTRFSWESLGVRQTVSQISVDRVVTTRKEAFRL